MEFIEERQILGGEKLEQLHIDSSIDHHGEKLLKIIEEITPKNLEHKTHTGCIKQLAKVAKDSMECDKTRLLILLESIKGCDKPCYKRDVLFGVIDNLFSSEKFIQSLVLQPFKKDPDSTSWKELANAISSIPDLAANYGATDKLPRLYPNEFYKFLTKNLYDSMHSLNKISKESTLSEDHKMYLLQLLGRIAISGQSQLIWSEFTSKVIYQEDPEVKRLVSCIFTLPIQLDDENKTAQFELFIDHLYMPIFYNLQPSRSSGDQIKSILGDKAIMNDYFKYIICDKSLLKTNYHLDSDRQNVILFNIFAYLASLLNTEDRYKPTDNSNNSYEASTSSLLIETLLVIVNSWSNSTKVLLRVYEHNRYVTSALLVAMKYALEYDRERLARHAIKIQSIIVNAIPTYLNRASHQLRNLAMCLGELLMSELYELVNHNEKKAELKFEVDYDEDLVKLQKLFKSNVEDIFNSQCTNERRLGSINHNKNCPIQSLQTVDNDDDDDGDFCVGDEDPAGVPIYLRDCISGLAENNNPRFVRLCLMKAGELICQIMSEHEANINNKSLVITQDQLSHNQSYVNDAIRDIAVELAQVLLYLDDQYNIDNFDAYRTKALNSLCVAAPDLVVKYLLDEFNGSNRSTRHQLDILQVLVGSAQQLSSDASKFVKFGPLYFYGIVYRLKAEGIKSPLSVISTRKEQQQEGLSMFDDSYLLSRILFSISLIIKCLNQQPILCKLSNDLIDILAAYRCHPDPGVHKAIVSCLKIIKDCTPGVFFANSIEDKMTHLFGPWLATKSQQPQQRRQQQQQFHSPLLITDYSQKQQWPPIRLSEIDRLASKWVP